MVLPIFVILSREVGEYYPISHYPMYATIDTRPVWYIYLADADSLGADNFPKALPMEHLTGVRPARAKKIYQTKLRDHALEIGLQKSDYYDLPPSQWESIGSELLGYFRGRDSMMRKRYTARGLTMPDRLALVFGEITISPGEPPIETRRLITTENR